MINFPLDATAMLMISAECFTGKSNSPVMEAPDPSFFLFTLNTRIVFPFAKAVINALKQNCILYEFMRDYISTTTISVFKSLNNLYPESLKNVLKPTSRVHSYNVQGASNNVFVPRAHTEAAKQA